jgi:hypothetical protein
MRSGRHPLFDAGMPVTGTRPFIRFHGNASGRVRERIGKTTGTYRERTRDGMPEPPPAGG